MSRHNTINYVEFATTDLAGTKRFFIDVFGWTFVDYGPDYASFEGAGIDGGFFSNSVAASTENGSVLVVLYSDALEDTQVRVEKSGGTIVRPPFEFPGGRRFHFREPGGNELAVWMESGAG